MSNFNFIQADFADLYADAAEAEQLTFISPKASAILCRSTLENAINWLYDHDAKLTRPWRADLSTLMHEPAFRALFNQTLFNELNLIRKTGNVAAHGSKVSQQDALACLKYLFRFMRFLAIYYGEKAPEPLAFDESLIPTPNNGQPQKESQPQLQSLAIELATKNQAAREAEGRRAEDAELA